MRGFSLKKSTKCVKPVYKELKVSELTLPDYQRIRLSMEIVKRYAQDFDWDIFGVPLVSYRDSKYSIVDGQHRIEVLKLLGIDTVLCQVLTGLTYEEEADKFVKLNTDHRVLNANQKFHGKVESKDLDALTIRDVLKQNNLTYAKHLCGNNETVVSAIATVERIYNKKGAAHLNRVLNILKQAWFGDKTAFNCAIMVGLSTYLSNSRGVQDGILISALERRMPNDVIVSANLYASKNDINVSCGSGGQKPHIAKVIRDLYNAEKQRLKDCSIIS